METWPRLHSIIESLSTSKSGKGWLYCIVLYWLYCTQPVYSRDIGNSFWLKARVISSCETIVWNRLHASLQKMLVCHDFQDDGKASLHLMFIFAQKRFHWVHRVDWYRVWYRGRVFTAPLGKASKFCHRAQYCGFWVVFWICYGASEKAVNTKLLILLTSKSHWKSQGTSEGFRGNHRQTVAIGD